MVGPRKPVGVFTALEFDGKGRLLVQVLHVAAHATVLQIWRLVTHALVRRLHEADL